MSTLPLVAVDIGNSSTKLGWDFARDGATCLPAPQRTFSFETGQLPDFSGASGLPPSPVQWAIASVHRDGSRRLQAWIAEHRPQDVVRQLTHRDFPIAIRVISPEKVGVDRLAAAAAANLLRPPQVPAIVIDAGSAITVDVVSADGAFEGGAILPGFRMSAQALYSADLLPLALLEPNDQPPSALGKDTHSAIRSGLFWGAVGAVRELVERLSADLSPAPDVIVTGGDLRQLAAHLSGSRFVSSLVLAGIALAFQSPIDRAGLQNE
jgi:type III pantothenate kinase